MGDLLREVAVARMLVIAHNYYGEASRGWPFLGRFCEVDGTVATWIDSPASKICSPVEIRTAVATEMLYSMGWQHDETEDSLTHTSKRGGIRRLGELAIATTGSHLIAESWLDYGTTKGADYQALQVALSRADDLILMSKLYIRKVFPEVADVLLSDHLSEVQTLECVRAHAQEAERFLNSISANILDVIKFRTR